VRGTVHLIEDDAAAAGVVQQEFAASDYRPPSPVKKRKGECSPALVRRFVGQVIQKFPGPTDM
jgi:hypothetical protein